MHSYPHRYYYYPFYQQYPISIPLMDPLATSFSTAFKASTFDDSNTAFKAIRDYAKAYMFAIFVKSSKPSKCV